MKKKVFINIVKIIIGLSIILAIIVFIMFNILKDNFAVYNSQYYVMFIFVLIFNSILLILLSKCKSFNNIAVGVIILIYLIITGLIPAYRIGRSEEPKGENSELMGISINVTIRNVYGMDITKVIR